MRQGDLLADRFTIEQRVGRGGMGSVFRAKDRDTGSLVAVKVLLEGQDGNLARFAQEAEVLAQLHHPSIVRYLAHGKTHEGEPFLAMEWLEGEDLKARLDREPLTPSEAVTLLTRVAHALGVAHERGIFHRDLKPSNLFLPGGRIEQVKVLDFGVARRKDGTQLTQTGVMIGTPGYMAPEQARGSSKVDARADVFALGCLLFRALTGELPFPGEHMIAVLGKILLEPAPKLRDRWPDAPADLDALCASLLAKDPVNRLPDGAAVAAALEALGPLPSGLEPKIVERSASRGALTGNERRVLSVVLASRRWSADGETQAIDVMPASVSSTGSSPGSSSGPVSRPTTGSSGGPAGFSATTYGGRLDNLADGSILVSFADERRSPRDQTAQAARCALAMRALWPDRLITLSTGYAQITGLTPGWGIIDRAAQRVGQMAAALGDGAPPIMLDEMSAGLLDGRFEVAETETGAKLLGERETVTGARRLLGKPTACVGREIELATVEALFGGVVDDRRAQAVVVTAPPGVGKSRFASEFLGRVRRRGEPVSVWTGRGDSLRAGASLDLLANALRGALGIREGEPLEDRRDKLGARVAEHVPAAHRRRVAEFLGELTSTPFPDDESPPLKAAREDAQLMSEQMRVALIDFLRAETKEHTVLLVLEDLHWGDGATVRFIDAALRELENAPFMVLALARPEVHEIFPRLWADRSAQVMRLKELSNKAAAKLCRQVLGDGPSADTVEHLVKLADGNAFYLEELIRATAEGRGEALPETVLAMVEARLGRLPGEARLVLRAASVFGQMSWKSALVSLLDGSMTESEVGSWLAVLLEREALVQRSDSRFSGQQELAFRNALLRDGAYATLTDEDRQRGHLLAGEWLEKHGESDPLVLGGHFDKGGAKERAGGFYLRAAEQAHVVNDPHAVSVAARLGLACEGPPELRSALLGVLSQELALSPNSIGDALSYAEEAMRISPPGSIAWGRGAFARVMVMFMTGRVDELLATAALLKDVTFARDALNGVGMAVMMSTIALDMLGMIPISTALADRFCSVVAAFENRGPLEKTWLHGFAAARSGPVLQDPWDAIEHIKPGMALATELHYGFYVDAYRMLLATNLWFMGAPEEAEALLADHVVVDTTVGTSNSFRRFCLAWLNADRGAFDQARKFATALCDDAHAHHNPLDEGRGRWVLAEVLRRSGDLEGAASAAEVAVAMLGMVCPLDHPGVLAELAAVRLAQGRVDEALATAKDALSRYEAMNACGLFRGACVLLTYAEAEEAAGHHEAACAAITKARDRLHTIAAKIDDPSYRKRFLEVPPENVRTLALARAWLGSDGAS